MAASRKIVVHTQVTLDNRISRADGFFWEPFAYGEQETAYVNRLFERADTWVMGRGTYQFVVPFWDELAAGRTPPGSDQLPPSAIDFARIQSGIDKVVLSTTLAPDPTVRRRVIRGAGVADHLAILKDQPGADIILSAGPTTVSALVGVPGLVDELFVIIHPAVLSDGPRMFDGLRVDLALQAVEAEVFDSGAIAVRYAVVHDRAK